MTSSLVFSESEREVFRTEQKSAYELAVEYIGDSTLINKSTNDSLVSRSVSLKTEYDSYPPFIRNIKANKAVWIVELDSIDLRSEKYIAMGAEDNYRIDLRVVIDSSTRSLVRIYSLEKECLENAAQYPSIDKEEFILDISNIRYFGLFKGIPRITFMDAIKASSTCSAGSACQISAELVYYAQGGSKEKSYPVWIIQTRGVSGGPVIGGDDKHGSYSYDPHTYRGRCIINAEDGSVYRRTLTNRN